MSGDVLGLDLPGAIPAPANSVIAGTVWHFGSPLVEQRELAAGRAVSFTNQRVLRLTGPDRLTWLNSISSQLLLNLAPGTSTETLILSPHGQIEFSLSLISGSDTLWALVEPVTATGEQYEASESPLVAWLQRMKFRSEVLIEDLSADFAVLSGRESAITQVVNHWGIDGNLTWNDPWPLISAGGESYSVNENHPGALRLWSHVIVPRSVATSATPPDSMSFAGSWASEALRIEAWRPRLGAETDDRSIPHELDWTRTAIHFNKGCYRGQETVAKVFNLGQPPRRLTMLHLDGSGHTLPQAGATVYLPLDSDHHKPGKTVGRLTSVALHHELGPIALAIIKRSAPTDAALLVESPDLPSNPAALPVAASQEVIVRERDHGERARVGRLQRP